MSSAKIFILLSMLVFVGMTTTCITPFSAKGVDVEEETLVIEGDIIVHGDTKIYLSFLKTLDGYYDFSYVTAAEVWVQDIDGASFLGSLMTETNNPPYFLIDTKSLGLDNQYKLCVRLYNGKSYESDFLTPIHTPAIDTIEYIINDTRTAVDFFVTTHGDADNAPYYKWSYVEDWEIISTYATNVYYDRPSNRFLEYATERPVYYCWAQSKSAAILIAKTDHLQDNIVLQQKLNTVTDRDNRISYLYSMELSQMSISKEAYTYWSTLKRNTDEIGGIFAPQPNDIYGNIRCVTDPGVRTIGYISAGTHSVKRIYVTHQELILYKFPSCDFVIPPIGFTNRDMYDTGHQIVGSGLSRIDGWVPRGCVDCTAMGTKNRPSFWPNNHL